MIKQINHGIRPSSDTRRWVSAVAVLLGGMLSQPAMASASEHCQMMASQSRIDYGTVTEASLRVPSGERLAGKGWRALPARDTTVTVVCDSEREIRLFFDGASTAQGLFRYGTDGAMVVRISSATLDNRSVRLTRLPGGRGNERDSLNVRANDGLRLVNGGRIVGKTASIQMTVIPYVKDTVTQQKEQTDVKGNVRVRLELLPRR